MRKIIETPKGFTVMFDYSPAIVNDIKLIPGRKFNYQDKSWTVPLSSRQFVDRLAKTHRFQAGNNRPVIQPATNMQTLEMPVLNMDIPLKRQLFSYQRQGVAYALQQKKVIVGDEMGLGKTAQAIATVIAAQAFPCLIICPSSLKINWEREFQMWGSHRATILSDSIKDTWPTLYQMQYADIFIVNYESLKKYFVAEINQPVKDGKKVPLRLNHIKFKANIKLFKSIICDESHKLKDIATQQAKFTKGIASGKEYILLLTGTPVVNKPEDLISQIGILDRINDFGGYQNFVRNYCDNNDRYRELNWLLKKNCYYRREKSEVLKELPPKMRQIVLCDITTRKEYNDAMSDLEDYLKRYRQATDAQIQKSMKGEIMVRIGILKNIAARGKIKDAIEYVSDVIDSGEKLILFTHLREVQDMIVKSFPAAVTIFGDDDTATRQRNVDRFQNDPKVQLIVCSIKAAGVGITLTASSRVAFLELPWHPADCDQAEARAHRIGQANSVQCIYLLGKDTIDEHIYEIINKKRDMSNQITGARDEVEVSMQNGVINLLSKNL
ncbi:MAG: DEAD/DEAH box helicase [Prevotella sp.]|nr:DEAD/DEAH box helicase [Prevotella sp.]